MIQRFAPLFTVSANHEYHGGPCRDFDYYIPAATGAILDGAHALARVVEGRLHVLIEVDGAGAPTIDLTGRNLLFGLRLKDPRFDNFTVPVLADARRTPLFANAPDPLTLSAPVGVLLAKGTLDYAPQQADRPLTLRLTSDAGAVLATRTWNAEDSEPRFDIRHFSDGEYRVNEQSDQGAAATTRVIVDAELRDAGPWGLLGIRVARSFAATPPVFTLSFAARSERLKYYVVARNYTAREFANLNVVDGGFIKERRPPIEFERIAPAAFAAGDLAPALLGDGTNQIALFRSKTAVPRRARGYGTLQLNRDGAVLLPQLPQPTADQRHTHFVIHLSKPLI